MINKNPFNGEKELKIIIFGGTFNPIHCGHIHLAECFADILGADRVILIPTNVPPHKRAPDLADAEDRLAMCRLAVKANERFYVSDIEIARGGQSYTSETLTELHRQYPDAQLYLVTGEDMFLTLEQWHDPQAIYRFATICAAPRSPQGTEALLEYAKKIERKGAKTRIENIAYYPISSTMVRDAVKAGQSISSLVPAAVEQYIREKKLYLS
jgi:nicotinate-nucleotide adenylyltransferase